MSEFDKEAEREKLREELAEDEEDRETTRRMSELLLQGATMTNAHCDRCGSPLFRMNDQTFCPTCQVAGQEGSTQARSESGQANATEAADGTPSGEAAGGAADAGVAAGGTPEAGPTAQETPGVGGTAGAGDLATARDSLVRTLTRYAEGAAETDDVGRAREYLAAAREAAEALAALERATGGR